VADEEGVDPRGDREDGAPLDAVGRADRLHLERVGDDEAVVAELTAEQARDDRPAEGRRDVVELGDEDVGRHDRGDAGGDRAAERPEARVDVVGHHGQL
jgi:hypothetical protein